MTPISSEHFTATLLETGIPPRPAALDIIATEMAKETPDFHLLARELRSDVALAAGIVKVANSSYFGLQTRVRTVLDAIEIMGLRSIATTVACLALKSAFPMLKIERFWDSSTKIANLSSWLVGFKGWKGVLSEEAFTFGLFRDCGIAVLLQRIPKYVDVLKLANEDTYSSFTLIEERAIPTNHALIGAMMTQAWWLPIEITEGIRWHHDASAIEPFAVDKRVPAKSGTLIAISQVSEYLMQQCTGLNTTKEWGKLGAVCLSRLNIDASELGLLCKQAEKHM